MSLHIRSEQTGDVAVLQCTGRIVRGETLHFLKRAVTSLKQPRVVVLDLSAVEMLDGGGLGMLTLYYTPGACSMAAHIVLEESGEEYEAKKVDLAGGEQRTEFVCEMLARTRLSCVFNISSVDDAVEILCTSHHASQDVDRIVA